MIERKIAKLHQSNPLFQSKNWNKWMLNVYKWITRFFSQTYHRQIGATAT